MNIRFLGKYNEAIRGEFVSFWSGIEIRYDFEITYEDNEDVELFEEELKLNLENQLGLNFNRKSK